MGVMRRYCITVCVSLDWNYLGNRIRVGFGFRALKPILRTSLWILSRLSLVTLNLVSLVKITVQTVAIVHNLHCLKFAIDFACGMHLSFKCLGKCVRESGECQPAAVAYAKAAATMYSVLISCGKSIATNLPLGPLGDGLHHPVLVIMGWVIIGCTTVVLSRTTP